MIKLAKTKKGITLVELLVSMTIFVIVTTLSVSAFMTTLQMKAMGSNMKNSQQKIRIALETVTRLSRQADKVEAQDNGKTLKLYFSSLSPKSAYKFVFYDPASSDGSLYLYKCVTVVEASGSCSDANWNNADPRSYAQDLFGGLNNLKLTNSVEGVNSFVLEGGLPPTLDININGKIPTSSGKAFYNDSIKINTEVFLENVK